MNKTLSKIVIVGICLLAGYSLHTEKDYSIAQLAFDNIEALAQGEDSENFYCLGSGSIDCFGEKVEMKVTGLRLD